MANKELPSPPDEQVLKSLIGRDKYNYYLEIKKVMKNFPMHLKLWDGKSRRGQYMFYFVIDYGSSYGHKDRYSGITIFFLKNLFDCEIRISNYTWGKIKENKNIFSSETKSCLEYDIEREKKYYEITHEPRIGENLFSVRVIDKRSLEDVLYALKLEYKYRSENSANALI